MIVKIWLQQQNNINKIINVLKSAIVLNLLNNINVKINAKKVFGNTLIIKSFVLRKVNVKMNKIKQ